MKLFVKLLLQVVALAGTILQVHHHAALAGTTTVAQASLVQAGLAQATVHLAQVAGTAALAQATVHLVHLARQAGIN